MAVIVSSVQYVPSWRLPKYPPLSVQKCGFIFCHKCNLPYSEWDKSTPMSALQYFVKYEKRIGIDHFLGQQHYELMMDLLFQHIRDRSSNLALPRLGSDAAATLCIHPTFQANEIFSIPIRTSHFRRYPGSNLSLTLNRRVQSM